MTLKFQAVLAALGLFTAGISTLHAQIEQRLNIQVTASMQGETNFSSTIEAYKLDKVRVTTKDILRLLGEATGNDFTNSRLVLVDFGSVQVISGEDFFDVTSFFFSEQTSDNFSNERFNNLNGRTRSMSVRTEMFGFGDGLDNDFFLSGFGMETFSASPINEDTGLQNISAHSSFRGSGVGHLGGIGAIFSGTVITSGKGKL